MRRIYLKLAVKDYGGKFEVFLEQSKSAIGTVLDELYTREDKIAENRLYPKWQEFYRQIQPQNLTAETADEVFSIKAGIEHQWLTFNASANGMRGVKW